MTSGPFLLGVPLEPYYEGQGVTLFHGDCIEVLRQLPDCSVDSVVTDPPYGLEFMGKDWDSFRYSNTGPQDVAFKDLGLLPSYSPNRRNQKCPSCGKWAYDHPGRKCECGGWKQPAQRSYASAFGEWCELWAAEALRVLKPGGHLLAFGGTRTWHRLAVAIEDAGFEIRDSIAWMYGSGFPKSLDVSKAIDKAAGAEREVVGIGKYANRGRVPSGSQVDVGDSAASVITAPATPDAARWQGWGTALKPAHEPIVVARKPLTGTVAANVLEHGTGALNIDGCRIPGPAGSGVWHGKTAQRGYEGGWDSQAKPNTEPHTAGRWPANVVLDEDQAAALDQQSGISTSRAALMPVPKGHAFAGDVYGGDGSSNGQSVRGHSDSGGASRFFYVAKAPARERPKVDGIAHPTVKPLTLMRWLCRLVTPPGGTVLEPFAGSGTTVQAALAEGFRCIAVEREDDYLPLILSRLTPEETADGQLTLDASA